MQGGVGVKEESQRSASNCHQHLSVGVWIDLNQCSTQQGQYDHVLRRIFVISRSGGANGLQLGVGGDKQIWGEIPIAF